jgi:phage FluMu gp28-like protein
MLDKARNELFGNHLYQLEWHARKNDPKTCRNRFILKSRQIGATYYFAWEAFEDAILNGDNQIFLSASRDQAEVFKAYIIAFARDKFELELKGAGFIELSNGAELRFLSTNSRTAQSYHGHLYIDEVFWIPDFAKMFKVASGMASHKKWRRTYFSTPSAQSHEAHPMWSGEKYNKGLSDKNKVEFDVSHKTLKNGQLGADKIWRHIVTVKDAKEQGCELFDIEELQTEYSKDDFDNLFMCKFIDDAKSVFSLNEMVACTLPDDDDVFTKYDPTADRPYGNRPVALGFDPSRTRDNASLIIMAVPLNATEKWVKLGEMEFQNKSFEYMANRIEEVCNNHNVVHIGVDTTGIGLGVYELIESFFPMVTPIHYSVESKTRLVLKAMTVIPKRLRYPVGDKTMTQSFMMIKKTITGSGNQITYAANRSIETGHADKAWATMHALVYESLNSNEQQTSVSFSN